MKKYFQSLLSSQSGSAMVQGLIAGALLIAGGAYVMKSQQSSRVLHKTVEKHIRNNLLQREITEVLGIKDICTTSLQKAGAMTSSSKELPGIFSAAGDLMYGPETVALGRKITKLEIQDYVVATGLRFSEVKLKVFSEVTQTKSTLGARASIFEIPLVFVTVDNVVTGCFSDPTGLALGAFEESCQQLGGRIDSVTGRCLSLHGTSGQLYAHLNRHLCSSSNVPCVHPYANFVCSNKPNWVITGFGSTGSPQCACVPEACPNPGSACLGEKLGTDKCGNICPAGTNPSLCPSPPVVADPSDPSTPSTPTPPTTPSTPTPPSTPTDDDEIVTWSTVACFTPGTKIDMANGNSMSIENIRAGDFVKAFDHDTGRVLSRRVVETFHHAPMISHLYTFYLETGRSFTANDIHRLWDPERLSYRSAREIHESFTAEGTGYLLSAEVSPERIIGIDYSFSLSPLYNFHVEGEHNYFAEGFLVHNEKKGSNTAADELNGAEETHFEKAAACAAGIEGCIVQYSYPRKVMCTDTLASKAVFEACMKP